MIFSFTYSVLLLLRSAIFRSQQRLISYTVTNIRCLCGDPFVEGSKEEKKIGRESKTFLLPLLNKSDASIYGGFKDEDVIQTMVKSLIPIHYPGEPQIVTKCMLSSPSTMVYTLVAAYVT